MKLFYKLSMVLSFLFCSAGYAQPDKDTSQNKTADLEPVIIDSHYTLSESLSSLDIPADIKKNLILTDVQYYSFDNKLHQGQMLVYAGLAKDIKEIFEIICKEKFPVEKAIPIVRYGWSDDKSMKDNNSSGFNYRFIKGTKILSAHAEGRAIDINPLFNPQIINGEASPENASYNPDIAGTITSSSFIVKEFQKRGWTWGGLWKDRQDYQHFEKR
ncbi:MAG: M15 family metallopeptidase [Ignavibacteria bacterium]